MKNNVPVESTGWLIQEKEARPHQDFKCNADPSSLSAADAAKVPVPDHSVGAILKSHFNDGALHQCSFIRPRHSIREPQPS